jgi:N-acetylneuraminic acid mutarotase
MNNARRMATATALPNGKVLVAGGAADSGFEPTSELYDPWANGWASGAARPPNMVTSRFDAAAALLPNGKVLVTGGGGASNVLASAELYDPATNTWATGADKPPDMNNPHRDHIMTVLPNGKVLVAGGYADTSGPTAPITTAELYDPGTNTWSNAGDMSDGRSNATATLLPNGKVLVAGGYHYDHALKSADLYDPATNTWAIGSAKPPDMPGGVHAYNPAALLPSGKVLVPGGFNGSAEIAYVDLYDPVTNTWATGASKPPDMTAVRSNHTANLLPNGRVLVVGSGSGDNAELYDPGTNAWSSAPNPATGRLQHTATSVCTRRVLAAAGTPGAGPGVLKTAELYSPDLTLPASGNLLVNGNAEGSVGAAGDFGVGAPLGWTVTPNFTTVAYGAPGGFPGPTGGGGSNFFAGGPGTPSSSACQTAAVAGEASAIDAGTRTATLSADLGGMGADKDNARVTATFLNGAGTGVGKVTVGPVTAADRGAQTKLLPRSHTSLVPAGTRAIKVVISAIRAGGLYDNAYVDNVSLRLAVAPPAIAGMKIKPSKFPAAPSGPSTAAEHKKRKTGATVSYTDTHAGTTTFAVLRTAKGRRVKGRCVKPTRKNRKGKRCKRTLKIGTFTHVDHAGANHFHFTGRVGGHTLNPGTYRLSAVPRNSAGKTGRPVSRNFRIVSHA